VNYERLFGDGSDIGLSIQYVVQPRPEGLAQAFLLKEEFAAGQPVALILGDNLFVGGGLTPVLRAAAAREHGATVFSYHVDDSSAYGVIELDRDGRPVGIEEKPVNPKSNLAVTGLYFYDRNVADFARTLKPSARGELEITDLNRIYLARGELHVSHLSRGHAWLDTGTHEGLLEASELIRTLQKRQRIQIACLEEIAFTNGFIDRDQLRRRADAFAQTDYGRYLKQLVDETP
jgi:glucose-1-phosphate thymidylyltransferase